MFNIDEKHLYPMGKPNPDTGMFPPPHHPCEPHKPPAYTIPETVEMLMAEVRASTARLLEFERRLETRHEDIIRNLTADNVLFKDTFAEAHRQFIQDVKNEVNVFEGNMNAALTLFQKTMEAEIGADLEKQNETINEAVAYMKDNLSDSIEGVLNEMEDNGELDEIVNRALNCNMVEYYGAIGDGTTDDTEAIQLALNSTDRVVFGAGKTYAITNTLRVPSNVEIDLRGATIVNNAATPIDMFLIEDVENIILHNGAIRNVWATGHESGEFIVIVSSSRNIVIENIRFANCISDGVYIGYQYYYDGQNKYATENVAVRYCHFDNIGRNGISLISGDDVFIENNVFENITNNDPKSGIDIEPETGSSHRLHFDNVQIRGNMFKKCTKGINVVQNGLLSYDIQPAIYITNNVFDESTFVIGGYNAPTNGVAKVVVDGAVFRRNGLFGIKVLNNPVVAPLTIKNIECNGTIRENTDFSYYGFITIMSGLADGVGGVTVDGVTLRKGDMDYRTLVNVTNDLDGGTQGYHSNVSVSGVNVTTDFNTGINIGQNAIGSVNFNGVIAKILGTYYQQSLCRYTDVVIPLIEASTTHTLNCGIHNKEMCVTLLGCTQDATFDLKTEGGVVFPYLNKTKVHFDLQALREESTPVVFKYIIVNGYAYITEGASLVSYV